MIKSRFQHGMALNSSATSELYGLSRATEMSYEAYFKKFVERFRVKSISAPLPPPMVNKITQVPASLLTDANIAIFLEEEWGNGLPDGTFKRVRAALQSAHQAAELGEIDWQDSAKFPKTWLVMKV